MKANFFEQHNFFRSKLLLLACILISPKALPLTQKPLPEKWNFIVYIASNNNLHRYVQQNIAQMQEIGSNKNINIVVQLDNFGKQEVTRLFIEKGKSRRLATLTKPPMSVSGTPSNLFDFVKSVVTKYPAEHTALILWNHGSGIKDPHIWGRTQPYLRDEAFIFNKKTQLYEVDREAFRNELLRDELTRGIAFNDAGHTFLTNQDLKATLLRIKKELLGGRKIDLLGMDACHMAMVEVCSQVKESAGLLVGSQEIEPGAGWNYSEVLKPFKTKSPGAKELALQVVQAYGGKYNHTFADLTQSAIDLTNQTALEENISEVSTRLIQLIKKDRTHLPLLINIRKSPQTTLAFLDSDYIDLSLFYKSLQEKLATHRSNSQAAPLRQALCQKLSQGLAILGLAIIQSTAGSRVRRAGGLSIYFPQHSITPSYLQTVFAQNTSWCALLGTCLSHNVRSIQEQAQIVR